MHEIKAIIRPDRLQAVIDALHAIPDLPGVTVSTVTGYGRRQPPRAPGEIEYGHVVMTKLEVVVPEAMLARALEQIRTAAATGHPGDGKVFVYGVQQAFKIRSTDEGVDAL